MEHTKEKKKNDKKIALNMMKKNDVNFGITWLYGKIDQQRKKKKETRQLFEDIVIVIFVYI